MLTPFERLNDDPTIACRKTLIGRLSFEHRFPHQTARRTQMQEDIRQCIQSQEKDQGIDTTGDMSDEWTKWLERQPKAAFKSVRTYQSPVSDNQQVLVECPSCGRRVSGGRGLEIHQQKSCRERRRTKKNTTKRGCENRQGRQDGSAEPATPRSRARMRGRAT